MLPDLLATAWRKVEPFVLGRKEHLRTFFKSRIRELFLSSSYLVLSLHKSTWEKRARLVREVPDLAWRSLLRSLFGHT